MKEFLSRRQEKLFTTISNGRQVASISVMAFLYVWTLSNISLMVGLAGQIKQSIPAGVTTLAAIDFGTLPVDAQDQISNAVCEYRDTDIIGVLR